MRLAVTRVRRNPVEALSPDIKSGNYLNNILGVAEAVELGADDCLMLNPAGIVTEASNSNVFFVIDGELVTPSFESGVLRGITKAAIGRLGAEHGFELHDRSCPPASLKKATECFVTSATREVMPVVSRAIGKRRVARIPRRRRQNDAARGKGVQGICAAVRPRSRRFADNLSATQCCRSGPKCYRNDSAMNKAFVREPDDDGRAFCPKCGTLGVPVNGGPLDTHIRSESRSKMVDAAWFCGFPRCDVAYFNLFGSVVLMDELKSPVYPYDANAPICACFGLNVRRRYRRRR